LLAELYATARYRPSTDLPPASTARCLPLLRTRARTYPLAPATLVTRGQMALPALHARQEHTRKQQGQQRALCALLANTPPTRRARHQRRACHVNPFRGRQREAATARAIGGTRALKRHARHAPQEPTKISMDRRRARSVRPTRTRLQPRSQCSASVTPATRRTPWGWLARPALAAPTRAQ